MILFVCLAISGLGDAFVWGTTLDDEIRSGISLGSRIIGGGRAYSTSADGHILVWDTDGNLLDAYATGIPGTDELFGAGQDGDSLVFVGFTSVLGTSDGLVIKSDTLANPSWLLAIGGSASECFEAVSAGYVLGYTRSWGFGETDVILIRMRQDNVIWARAIGDRSFDYGKDIEVLGGDAIIVGYTESYGQLGQAMVMRVDSFGNIKWFRIFGGAGYDTGERVALAGDTIIVAGRDASNGGGVLVFALSSAGQLLWSRLVRATGYEFPMAIAAREGSIYIAGRHTIGGPAFLVELSRDGSLIWGKYLGGNSSDGIGALLLGTGEITALGYTSSFGFGRRDFFFASVDTSGYNCTARDVDFASTEISLPSKDTAPEVQSVSPSVSSLGNTLFQPPLDHALWCEGTRLKEELSGPYPFGSGTYDCTGRLVSVPINRPGVYFRLGTDGRIRRFVIR